MLSYCDETRIQTSQPSCLHAVLSVTLHPHLSPAFKCIHGSHSALTEDREGVAGTPRCQCPQRPAARGGQSWLTVACGLVEARQFDASELYKYCHLSTGHVGERVGTFRLCCLGPKGLHLQPPIRLCQPQPPHPHSSAALPALPTGLVCRHGGAPVRQLGRQAVNQNHRPGMVCVPERQFSYNIAMTDLTVCSLSQPFNRHFTGHLLFARHCSRHWESRSDGNRPNSCPHEVSTHIRA